MKFSIEEIQEWLLGRRFVITGDSSSHLINHNKTIEVIVSDVASHEVGLEAYSLKVKQNAVMSGARCHSKTVWTLQVILELVGEGKPFKNSSEAFANLDWEIINKCWGSDMTQYETAKKYIKEHS